MQDTHAREAQASSSWSLSLKFIWKGVMIFAASFGSLGSECTDGNEYQCQASLHFTDIATAT